MIVRVHTLLVAAATVLGGDTVRRGFTKDCVHSVKESIVPPRGWVVSQDAPKDHIINLQIFLPQPNFPSLEKALYEISDPDHTRYGLHLSKEEVENLVAPHPYSLSSVDTWLESHGIDIASLGRAPANDWVTVRVPVAKAEEMLQTKYHVWTHVASGDSLVRTTSYSLPTDLHAHVDLVQPTTSFSRMQPHKATFQWDTGSRAAFKIPAGQSNIIANGQSVDASCNTTITLTCLRQLYNAVGIEGSGRGGNEVGVTAYLEQFANLNDFQLFLQAENPSTAGFTFNVVSVNGGINNQSLPGGEANLDTQFAFGLAGTTPATFWTTAGMPPFIPDTGTTTDSNEPYSEWLNFVLSQDKIPQTISTSYGDDEQTVPLNFAQRVCGGFAQLGIRGTSVLFSSGDGGVGDNDPDPATQQCFTNDGKNQTRFIPAFPATCPFVTSVGATFQVPEVAVDFSGGGFSNVFSRPPFQEVAVPKFLSTLPKNKFEGLFNPNGRGIPDVSAQGVNFEIFFAGSPAGISGTSASAPSFAGLISLINDARLSQHLPSLGFLNPLIYKIPQAFNDITIGNNPGCGTEGFNATKGWDPISGLGTPDVRKLLAQLS